MANDNDNSEIWENPIISFLFHEMRGVSWLAKELPASLIRLLQYGVGYEVSIDGRTVVEGTA